MILRSALQRVLPIPSTSLFASKSSQPPRILQLISNSTFFGNRLNSSKPGQSTNNEPELIFMEESEVYEEKFDEEYEKGLHSSIDITEGKLDLPNPKKISLETTKPHSELSFIANTPLGAASISANHVNQMYICDSNVDSSFLEAIGNTQVRQHWKKQFEYLRQQSFLIRKDTLFLDMLLSSPVSYKGGVRVILDGKQGTGKTCVLATLALMRLSRNSDEVNIYIPDPLEWNTFGSYITPSTRFPEMYNNNREATSILAYMSVFNDEIFKKVHTKKEYVWNHKIKTPIGTSLSAMIAEAVKFSQQNVEDAYESELILAILDELRNQNVRTFVFCDNINALFTKTIWKTPLLKDIPPEKLVLNHGFAELLHKTTRFTNGGFVTAVSHTGYATHPISDVADLILSNCSDMTISKKKLRQIMEGDVALAANVLRYNIDNYTDIELQVMLYYYMYRNWTTKVIATESVPLIKSLSGSNPRQLASLIATM